MKKSKILKFIAIITLIAAATAVSGVSRQGLYQPKVEPIKIIKLKKF